MRLFSSCFSRGPVPIEVFKDLVTSPRFNLNAQIRGRFDDGKTALHLLIEEEAGPEYVKTLIETPGVDCNIRDSKGHTALHATQLIERYSTDPTPQFYEASEEVLELLFERPDLEVNATNNKHHHLLHQLVVLVCPHKNADKQWLIVRLVWTNCGPRETNEKAGMFFLRQSALP